MSEDLISVIIPVFNGQDHLARAVGSVLLQEMPYEIIIVDDGSTDDSWKIACDFAKKYPQRIFAISQANGGQGMARNTGLRLARGEYCCFIDVDDEYAPDFFRLARHTLNSDKALVAAVCRVELVNLHRPIEPWQLESVEASIPCNLIARTEVVRRIGFPTESAFRGQTGGEDCVFREELHEAGSAVMICKPLYRHHIRQGGHFDFFLDRSFKVGDNIGFRFLTKEEENGAIADASRFFKQKVLAASINRVLSNSKTASTAIAQACVFNNMPSFVHAGFSAEEWSYLLWLFKEWPQRGTVQVFADDCCNFQALARHLQATQIRLDSKTQLNGRRSNIGAEGPCFYNVETITSHVPLEGVSIVIVHTKIAARDALCAIADCLETMPEGSLLATGCETSPLCAALNARKSLWWKLSSGATMSLFCRGLVGARDDLKRQWEGQIP